MASIDQLEWTFLTPVINEMRSPNEHFSRIAFGRRRSLPTETAELSTINRDREMAPFVLKNGEAIMVSGHSATFQTVTCPNIRIKIPFTPSDLLFKRRPGTTIFQQGSGSISAAISEHVSRDLQGLVDMIRNTHEWLCAQAIIGTVTYDTTVDDMPGDSFEITFPKPSGHNVTLTTFWDDATPADTDMKADFMTVKRLMAVYGLAPWRCYLGQEASVAFLDLLDTLDTLDRLWIDAGKLDLGQQFDSEGVIFLGRFMGVDIFEYSRSVTNPSGSAEVMVRAKYAEFLPRPSSSQWISYFGAIPDMKALRGRMWQGEIFSKSWEEEDPSVFIALAHSRPLPCPRRPYNVSVKVVSG